MKKIILLLFVLWTANLTAQEIEVKHQIDKVTVYLSGAEIARSGQVQVPQGKSTLVFAGISSSIAKNGIHLVFDNKNIKVLEVGLNDKIEYENDDEWKRENAKYLSFDNQIDIIKLKINSFEKQLSFLEKNMTMNGNTVASITQLDSRANYFQKKIESNQEKIYNLKKEIKQLKEKKEKVELKMRKVEAKFALKSKTISVLVQSKQALTTHFDLKYIVANASWKPYYSINAIDKNEKIDFDYQAKIYNNTGNDWKNKALTLAIVNPNDNIELPKMNAWTIGEDSRYMDSEGRLNNFKGKALSTQNVEMNYDEPELDVIKVDDINTKFVIKTSHLIPSDAKPHLIDVKKYKTSVKYFSLSIPKIKKDAYLVARIPHWRQMGLMDADINLYYNNAFQGVSRLNTGQMSDTLNVSLGKDMSFTVTRRKLKSKNKAKMIGFNVVKELTYEIVVTNNRKENQSVEVRDQIPVASDSDVKIEAVDLANASLHKSSGRLTWKVDLAPYQTKKIVFSFNIKVPKNKSYLIDGINDTKIMSPRFF
jgi:uncharacterized protein (TIGR02231 family)